MFAELERCGLVEKKVVAMRSSSAKRSCMVSTCSIIMFLVMILSLRVDAIFVEGVICRAERSLPRSRWSSVMVWSVLLAFPPTIDIAMVVGLGTEIGWMVVGRVHILCLF